MEEVHTTQSKEARKQNEYPLEYLKRPVRSYQMLTTTPGRIIVVDDDAQVRTLLRNLLETEGYVVSEAANGGEMRSLLATQSASLITLDLKLAGEDGLAPQASRYFELGGPSFAEQ
jgi:PleD family two-component response regulator